VHLVPALQVTLTIVLLSSFGGMRVNAECLCARGKPVRVSAVTAGQFLVRYTLPPVLHVGVTVDDEPEVYSFVFDADGAVCSVGSNRVKVPEARDSIMTAIRSWRFKPVRALNEPTCVEI